MKTARRTHRSFLTRLGRNEAGNTLAIVAAAILPLAGMIGGALDISRSYLVKTRLSQACDAGVLAGRRMMGSDGTLTTAVTAEVQKFVNFNFPQGYMGTTAFTVTPTTDTNRQVVLSLQTTVPTAIMRLFGKTSVAVATSCTARNDYSNIDIVLVLDTTGSMACSPSVSSCSPSTKTTTVNGRTVSYLVESTDSSKNNISRIQALREALADLQTDIGKIETEFNAAPSASRKRVRWAIIPFSQMVNVGGSMGYDFGGDGLDTGSKSTLYARKPDWFNTSATYCSSSYSCSVTSHDSTWMANTWDGCVEERATSNSITSTSTYVMPGPNVTGNMPTGANDLQMALDPTTTATRWTVADPAKTGSAQYACPRSISELQQMTSTEFNNYFTASNGFLSNGGTYLDIGMLWAARLLASDGLWKSENIVRYHDYTVARYVIFMTDGEMDTGNSGYAAYAQENIWKRVTTNGNATTNVNNHSRRLAMICDYIKNSAQAKIFAISFSAGSSLTDDLSNCASGSNYAYRASDETGLQRAFHDIGVAIGSLRLSQ